MKRALALLLCLGLAGCGTIAKKTAKPPESSVGQIAYIPKTEEKAAAAEEKTLTPEKKAAPSPENAYIISQGELDNIIALFTQAIKSKPKNGGYYYNRALAYFYRGEYSKSREDFYKAIALGCAFSPEFIQKLKQVSDKNS